MLTAVVVKLALFVSRYQPRPATRPCSPVNVGINKGKAGKVLLLHG